MLSISIDMNYTKGLLPHVEIREWACNPKQPRLWLSLPISFLQKQPAPCRRHHRPASRGNHPAACRLLPASRVHLPTGHALLPIDRHHLPAGRDHLLAGHTRHSLQTASEGR